MDFSGLVGAVDFSGVELAVLAIAAVTIVVLAVEWGVGKVLGLLGGGASERSYEGESGDWAGYTAEDDARDRAAAGLGPNLDWQESADASLAQWQDDESERPGRGG